MGSEWEKRPLKDCAVWFSGGTPKKSDNRYWGGSTPWISAKSLTDFYVRDSEDRVTDLGISKGTRLVPEGTVLFVVRGMSLKKEFRMGIARTPVAFNQDLKALVPVEDVYPYYLAYAIRAKSQDILGLVSEAGHGTGVLSTDLIQSLEILLPSFNEQKLIGDFFKTIDDKIELNRRMNETLEAMAQALFKSWFIDFDPVIDNALAAGNPIPEELQPRAAIRESLGDARKPLPDDIRNLFPSEFELTEEMGWVPKGWDVSCVGDVLDVVGGGTPKTSEPDYWENGIHLFCTPKDMSKLESPILISTERRVTDKGAAKISSGTLPVGTVLLSSRAPIGYLAIAEEPVTVNQGIIAMNGGDEFSPMFVKCWAKENMDNVIARANGSTFLEISKKNFRPIPFLVPARELSALFNEKACDIYARMVSCTRSSRDLSVLRDALLAKLLSGEIRISEAEKLAEAAA